MKDKMKQRRVIFIDYIRALAILMVIMCHVIDVNCMFWLGYQDMSGARQIILYTLLIFGRCGVPLFLMITGYLLLDRDYSDGKWKSFYLHKWLYLLLVTEIWFAIYEVFAVCVQGKPFVWKDFVLRLLFIEEPVLSHAWYLPVILGLYWGYICSCLFLHWFGKNFPIGDASLPSFCYGYLYCCCRILPKKVWRNI